MTDSEYIGIDDIPRNIDQEVDFFVVAAIADLAAQVPLGRIPVQKRMVRNASFVRKLERRFCRLLIQR